MASKFPVNGIVNNDSRHERHGSPTGCSRRREHDSKHARSRSRSPYRANKKVRFDSAGHGGKYQDGNPRKDEKRSRDWSYDDRTADSRRDTRLRSVSRSPPRFSKREPPPKPTVSEPTAPDADKKASIQSGHDSREQSVVSDVSEDASTAGEAADTAGEVLDEAALIEQRRKRREAIRAKHQSKEPNLLQTATNNAAQHPSLKTPEKSAGTPKSQHKLTPPGTPMEELSPASEDIDLAFDGDMANTQAQEHGDLQEDEPSAADYDPSQDMQKDKLRQEAKALDESSRTDVTNTEPPQAKSEVADEDDMFGGEDDMFADTAQPIIDKPASKKVAMNGFTSAKALDANLLDDWDDPEGYYKVIIDELLDGRYHVQASLGKGMFSGVIRAFDQETKQLVAIKIIRNNEIMRKAAAKEIKILQNLTSNDPKNKKHVVRLERTFEHKGHLCMVFENLNINLREVLKKFGRDVGINLKAVRIYAQQIFIGLHHMRECKIVHADLKPDNILINDSREVLKIADLGSATEISESEITPYLVSRFYRAPEIILGQKYDYSIDVWSIGCTLFELYTGKILFTGRSNNQMLRVMMECRGKFSPKMLKSSSAVLEHFDPTLQNFQSIETDKISGRQVVRSMNVNKPVRSLRSRLMANADGLSETEQSELKLFIDLLEKCLQLDPEKRCTPGEALKHPFIYRAKK